MEASILRSFLVLAWWIGMWGLADTLVHGVFKGSVYGRLAFYSSLILAVGGVVAVSPKLLEHL